MLIKILIAERRQRFSNFWHSANKTKHGYFRSKYEQQGPALTEPDPLSVSLSQRKPNFHIYVISIPPITASTVQILRYLWAAQYETWKLWDFVTLVLLRDTGLMQRKLVFRIGLTAYISLLFCIAAPATNNVHQLFPKSAPFLIICLYT